MLRYGLDDPLDAVAVHCGGGTVGVLLVHFFAYGKGIFWMVNNRSDMAKLRSAVFLPPLHQTVRKFLSLVGDNFVRKHYNWPIIGSIIFHVNLAREQKSLATSVTDRICFSIVIFLYRIYSRKGRPA
jgi:hypothetical protein